MVEHRSSRLIGRSGKNQPKRIKNNKSHINQNKSGCSRINLQCPVVENSYAPISRGCSIHFA